MGGNTVLSQPEIGNLQRYTTVNTQIISNTLLIGTRTPTLSRNVGSGCEGET